MADFSKRYPPGYLPTQMRNRENLMEENLFFLIFVEAAKNFLFFKKGKRNPRHPVGYYKVANDWIRHDIPMGLDGLEGEWSFVDFLTELIGVYPENCEEIRMLLIKARESDLSKWPNLINQCLEYMNFIGTEPDPWWKTQNRRGKRLLGIGRYSEKDELNSLRRPYAQGFHEYSLRQEEN